MARVEEPHDGAAQEQGSRQVWHATPLPLQQILQPAPGEQLGLGRVAKDGEAGPAEQSRQRRRVDVGGQVALADVAVRRAG